MKKFWSGILIVCLLLVFSGCSSSNEADDLTMDKFIEAFNNSGEDITNGVPTDGKKGIDKEEKPKYESMNAVDGVMFNIGNSPVKIYEYKTTKDLNKSMEDNSLSQEDYPNTGKFLLVTKNEKAKEIFNSVK